MRSACFTIILLASVLLCSGCAATGRPAPTVQELRSTLTATAMESAQFAAFVRDFVERSLVEQSGKPLLIARASMLEQHAKAMLDQPGQADARQVPERRMESATITARLTALRAERATLEQEWTIWQVANGVKRAEDTELRLVMPDGDC